MRFGIGAKLTWSLFRPISSTKGEIAGTLYRARHLIKIARNCLKPIPQEDETNGRMKMMIVKEPIGVIG
jgi:acyl-CoA reductase-like NAD-dependent aldehyde dehydrogenase